MLALGQCTHTHRNRWCAGRRWEELWGGGRRREPTNARGEVYKLAEGGISLTTRDYIQYVCDEWNEAGDEARGGGGRVGWLVGSYGVDVDDYIYPQDSFIAPVYASLCRNLQVHMYCHRRMSV